MKRFALRERGIYHLSDGREFIACTSGDGEGYLLYSPQTWESYGLPEYRVHADGSLLSRGGRTRWHVEDLTDTGQSTEQWEAPPDCKS